MPRRRAIGAVGALFLLLTFAPSTAVHAYPARLRCAIDLAPGSPQRLDDQLVGAATLSCNRAVSLGITVEVFNKDTGAFVMAAGDDALEGRTVRATATTPCLSFTGPYYDIVVTGYAVDNGRRTEYSAESSSSPYCET